MVKPTRNQVHKYCTTSTTNWFWIYLQFFLVLKVSKSQKQFFLKLHCLRNKMLDNILPYEAGAEIIQIFRSFFGQWSFKKKCFWDLLTLMVKSIKSQSFKIILNKHLNFNFETSIWCCQILIASRWRKVSKITKVLTNLSFKWTLMHLPLTMLK